MVASRYDVIVVGAGTAGCVLAGRLSQDSHRSVLLLEAGPDYPELDRLPDDLKLGTNPLRALFGPHLWQYRGTANEYQARPMVKPKGKVTGGTSAINGGIAVRGAPEDYDQWAAWGNDEWAFAKVLPYFRKLETDLDFGGDFHGSSGPLPIQRSKREEWLPMTEAFYQACLAEGFRADPDQNHPESTGVGPLPRNIQNGVRVSTALAYLAPARPRPNLTIRPNTTALRVLFDGQRATGVEIESNGQRSTVEGAQIILSAGAIGSPQLLMLSGVGPEGHLRSLGIPVVRPLPGVGENLRDHPGVSMLFRARGLHTDPMAPSFQLALRCTAPSSATRNDLILGHSRMPGELVRRLLRDVLTAPRPYLRDLGVGRTARMAMEGLRSLVQNQPYLALVVILVKASTAGRLHLASTDIRVQPVLTYRYLSDPWDRERVKHGVRLAFRLCQQPALRKFVLAPVFPTEREIADDGRLDAWMLRNVSTHHHDSGTCKMGPASDPMAVVDQHCRVHGVEGLHVVDASVMPDVIRANTNVPTIMIAERVADWIKEGR